MQAIHNNEIPMKLFFQYDWNNSSHLQLKNNRQPTAFTLPKTFLNTDGEQHTRKIVEQYEPHDSRLNSSIVVYGFHFGNLRQSSASFCYTSVSYPRPLVNYLGKIYPLQVTWVDE